MAASTALLSCATIAGGVPAGATRPTQVTSCTLGQVSASVGTSGAEAVRAAPEMASARSLPVGASRLDLDTRQVHRSTSDTDPIRLSDRECTLLATLAARPGQVYSRRDLLAIVFPEAENDIIVDTYVHYLRRKLGREVVATVRGRGYQLGQP